MAATSGLTCRIIDFPTSSKGRLGPNMAETSVVEHDGELLLHVAHGSRLSRAWLGASLAASNDAERPALYRVTAVEVFDGGYRLTSRDSYWIASAWVGDPVDPDEPFEALCAAPEPGEISDQMVPVVDLDFRIRDLMRYVARLTAKVDPEHPDIPLTFTIARDRSDVTPTLDPLFDRDRVDVSIPAVERVAGHVNEVEFPNTSRFHWEYNADTASEMDRVQLSPSLLRRLASACAAVDADGCLFAFHGDPAKPISWEVVQPAAAVLFGLVMPQRQRSDDTPATPPPTSDIAEDAAFTSKMVDHIATEMGGSVVDGVIHIDVDAVKPPRRKRERKTT